MRRLLSGKDKKVGGEKDDDVEFPTILKEKKENSRHVGGSPFWVVEPKTDGEGGEGGCSNFMMKSLLLVRRRNSQQISFLGEIATAENYCLFDYERNNFIGERGGI